VTVRRYRSRGVLAVVLVATVLLVACGTTREPQTIEIVVPPGTADLLAAGELVDVMPTRIVMRAGDTLHIRNEDKAAHPVGPHMVKAEREVSFVYRTPGTYEGYCPLSKTERYVIYVEK